MSVLFEGGERFLYSKFMFGKRGAYAVWAAAYETPKGEGTGMVGSAAILTLLD